MSCYRTQRTEAAAHALMKRGSVAAVVAGDPALSATQGSLLPEDEETKRLRRRAELLNLGGRSCEGAGLLTPAPEKR